MKNKKNILIMGGVVLSLVTLIGVGSLMSKPKTTDIPVVKVQDNIENKQDMSKVITDVINGLNKYFIDDFITIKKHTVLKDYKGFTFSKEYTLVKVELGADDSIKTMKKFLIEVKGVDPAKADVLVKNKEYNKRILASIEKTLTQQYGNIMKNGMFYVVENKGGTYIPIKLGQYYSENYDMHEGDTNFNANLGLILSYLNYDYIYRSKSFDDLKNVNFDAVEKYGDKAGYKYGKKFLETFFTKDY